MRTSPRQWPVASNQVSARCGQAQQRRHGRHGLACGRGGWAVAKHMRTGSQVAADAARIAAGNAPDGNTGRTPWLQQDQVHEDGRPRQRWAAQPHPALHNTVACEHSRQHGVGARAGGRPQWVTHIRAVQAVDSSGCQPAPDAAGCWLWPRPGTCLPPALQAPPTAQLFAPCPYPWRPPRGRGRCAAGRQAAQPSCSTTCAWQKPGRPRTDCRGQTAELAHLEEVAPGPPWVSVCARAPVPLCSHMPAQPSASPPACIAHTRPPAPATPS